MKNIKIIVSSILLGTLLVGCGGEVKETHWKDGVIKTRTEFNSQGQKHGMHREYDMRGNLIYEIQHENGVQVGKSRRKMKGVWFVWDTPDSKGRRE